MEQITIIYSVLIMQCCVNRMKYWPTLPISINRWTPYNWKCSTTTSTSSSTQHL